MSTDTTKQIEVFFSHYRKRDYPKGQILIHSGDAPEYVYYLVSGKVRQYDVSYRGDEIVVNVFKQGAFFPMLPVITKLPNRYFFEGETDIETFIAPPEDVAAFLKASPDVVYDLLARVYTGLDGLLERMFRLMSGSARSRVIYELLLEYRRFGEQQKDGSFFVPLHVGDLAARAGLSRETASREIQKIGKDGLIKVSHKGITVTDLGTLEKRLGAEL